MIIVIRWTEWLRDTKVERFADLPNAQAYEASLPADQTVYIFDTDAPRWLEAQFELRYSTPKLVEIFRAIGGEVNKFENKDTGLRRVGLKILDLANNSTLQTYVVEVMPIHVETNPEDIVMAREVKIGEFKPVRTTSDLGKVLAAAFSGDGTLSGIADDTALNQDKVKSILSSGRRSHGVDFQIGAETGYVTIKLPDGVTQESVFAAAKEPKPAKEPRELKIGEFKQVRRTSTLGKLVEAAQDGSSNVADLAVLLGETEETVTTGLKNLRRGYGIDHVIGDMTGYVSLLVPEGQDPFIPLKEKVVREPGTSTRAAKGEPRGKPPGPADQFKPLRAGTVRDQLISFMDGTLTAAQIADKIGKTTANTSSHIFCLWRDCGIGFQYDAEGKVSVLPPDGMSVSSLVQRAA